MNFFKIDPKQAGSGCRAESMKKGGGGNRRISSSYLFSTLFFQWDSRSGLGVGHIYKPKDQLILILQI